jgi:hypothetical protein
MLATLMFAAAALSASIEPPKWCSAVSAAHQTALVELYTSQGCSSCPPADRWLSQLEQRYTRTQIVPIALHVSYWDYIGWKDPYARADFNLRQRDLAAANGSRTVYTPGVFLQARELSDWSKATRFDAAVRAVVATPAEARITLKARIAGDTVTVEPNAVAFHSTRDPRLVVALVESGLSVAVEAGENRGETLRNDRVVRAWSGPLALTPAPLQWTLPMGAERRYAVVAFVQESAPNGRLLQAMDLPLSGC